MISDCVDDQGNGFTLLEVPADAPRPTAGDARVGDVAYVTISPGDEVRASAFYGTLFGWEIAAGNVPRGLRVDGLLPMTGIWGGTGRQTVTLMYVVEDVTAAVARVRASGGTASDPEQQPYGITADCTDDQGTAFSLGQL